MYRAFLLSSVVPKLSIAMIPTRNFSPILFWLLLRLIDFLHLTASNAHYTTSNPIIINQKIKNNRTIDMRSITIDLAAAIQLFQTAIVLMFSDKK
jgi:hypothetical protein